MNEQIIRDRQGTPWLMLAGGLITVLMVSLLVWLSRSPAQPGLTHTLTSTPAAGPGSEQLLQSLPKPLTNTVLTISEVSDPVVGQLAPDFTLKTFNDQEIRLSDLRGRLVVINFWASWCTPCRLEMPVLQNVYETRQVKDLDILAVNVTSQDTVSGAKDFVEQLQLTLPILLDEAGTVSETYHILGLPTSIFVDRQGMIQRIYLGPMTQGQINQFITEIYQK